MIQNYKYKTVCDIKFRIYKKLSDKSWKNKQQNIYLIYYNSNYDDFHVWECDYDKKEGKLVSTFDPKNNLMHLNYFKDLLKEQSYFLQPTTSINNVLEDMGFEVDYTHREEGSIIFRERKIISSKSENKNKKRVEKPIPESMWIRARNYQ
ncbi:MAG: hypothetical protein GTO02_22315 [Candidatus Dadabacteria bacterium]|nr:hypothetical protein [Candidatus Dadabacteria bacterium]